jgi:hypothetical protein
LWELADFVVLFVGRDLLLRRRAVLLLTPHNRRIVARLLRDRQSLVLRLEKLGYGGAVALLDEVGRRDFPAPQRSFRLHAEHLRGRLLALALQCVRHNKLLICRLRVRLLGIQYLDRVCDRGDVFGSCPWWSGEAAYWSDCWFEGFFSFEF